MDAVTPGSPHERIRIARERAGLEPMEVAERLGLPQAHYRDLEFHPEAPTRSSPCDKVAVAT